MTYGRESIDLPEDRGCLRWVLGVPLGLIYLPAVYICVLLLMADPIAPLDHRMRDDAHTMGVVAVCISFAGLLLSLLPVYRRTMNRWWYAVPVVLGAIAYIRAETL
ncbi:MULTISPECIES: hypothetical protein [unclassified Streptomyces]|uniref:hypothetical protein n=1 Tax=unclassified Streptomyces TaxID=2593676 RepID=UPI002E1189BD|nr:MULTISPECIES: hypothetical protein [unclassified Streptomyces]WSR27430.1 hypothetical protein OG573_15620 [Streptomyces sp. NBC_01205]